MEVGRITNNSSPVVSSKQTAENPENIGFVEMILTAMQNIPSADISPSPVNELHVEDVENKLVEVEQFQGLTKLDASSLLRKLISSVEEEPQHDVNQLLEKLLKEDVHAIKDDFTTEGKTLRKIIDSLITCNKEIPEGEFIPEVQPETVEISVSEEKTDDLTKEETLILGEVMITKTFNSLNTVEPNKIKNTNQINAIDTEAPKMAVIDTEAVPLNQVPAESNDQEKENASFDKVYRSINEKLTEVSEKPNLEKNIEPPQSKIPHRAVDIKQNQINNIENKLNSVVEQEASEVKDENFKHSVVQQSMPVKSDSLASLKSQEADKVSEGTGMLKINREELLEVTVNRFKSLRLPDLTELKVRLKPEELGEIAIKVVLEKGQINGTITASNKEVVNMLQSNMDSLRQELKNNNLNLNNLSVNINNSGDFEGHNFSQQRGHDSRQFRGNAQNYKEQIESYNKFEEEEGINIIA